MSTNGKWVLAQIAIALLVVLCALLYVNFSTKKLYIKNPNQIQLINSLENEVLIEFVLVSNTDLDVIFVETNCNCSVVSNIPVTINARIPKTVRASIDPKKMAIPGKAVFVFHTNPPIDLPVATVELRGPSK